MLRAEPISALYEQGKVHHVGYFKELEEQMCSYTPDTVKSPDRLDALVWGISSLMNSGRAIFRIS
jgi:phage terminase large subunit-like protein